MSTEQMRKGSCIEGVAMSKRIGVLLNEHRKAADEIDALRADNARLDSIATEAAENCNQYAMLNARLNEMLKDYQDIAKCDKRPPKPPTAGIKNES